MINRRDFCLSLGAVAATASPASRAWAALMAGPPAFEYREVPGGGFVILGDGGRVLIMPTERGPVMIDAKFLHTAGDLFEQVVQHVHAPPALLINTHHHRDHTGGNWKFSPHAEIIAHENLAPRLAGNLQQFRQAAQQQVDRLRKSGGGESELNAAIAQLQRVRNLTTTDFAPDRQCSTELSINHGGLEIIIRYSGNAHTDNDVVVFLPKPNILHMGDLLFHKLHPFIDKSAAATTKGWQHSVREAMKLGDEKTIVIPGHGDVTDKTALPKQIEYFDQLRAIVEAATGEGKSREEIIALKPGVFAGRGFERMQSHALGVMYDELKAGS